MKRKITLTVILFIAAVMVVAQQIVSPDQYIKRTFRDTNGQEIHEIIVPGKPPAYRMPVAQPTRAAVLLNNVPAYDWSFGCSATAAAMMAGYYDRTGYTYCYTGPTDGGLAPLDNSIWGTVVINGETRSLCPLSATRDGLDGRYGYGHVDDYWIQYGSSAPDPYITGMWTQHTYGECTGDYMGTNQSALSNSDGSTTFYYYPDNNPLHNFIAPAGHKDGCNGLREFFESRTYPVFDNFTQRIYGYNGITNGFTFAQYMAEIDAGRPVLIQVSGHTMLGLGYDASFNTVYLHDTWDYNLHSMTWGSTYAGLQQWGVTVMQLQPASPSISIYPTSMYQALYPNGIGYQTMTIYNNGNYALDYSIDLSYPAKSASVTGKTPRSATDTPKINNTGTPVKNALVVNKYTPKFLRSTVYYNQTGNPSAEGSFTSQRFTDPGYEIYTNQAADDFEVPSGPAWNIRHVFVNGGFWNGGFEVPAVDVVFYSDASGFPGAVVSSFTNISADGDATGNLNIFLPAPVVLTPGHYWVSVVAVMDLTTHGQWGWTRELAPTIYNEYTWQNPGGGFGGCTSWCYSSVMWPTYIDQNLGFALTDSTKGNWLSASPLTGSIPAYSYQDIEVVFDATGLSPDHYAGHILVNSNDPSTPVIDVPADLDVVGPYGLPLTEDWSSVSFGTNGWTTTPYSTHWQPNYYIGNPAPGVIFDWFPAVTGYDQTLISRSIDATSVSDNLTLKYDITLSNYSSVTLEELAVEIWDGSAWQVLKQHSNASGSIPWTTETIDITSLAANRYFNIRFRAYGENTYNIWWWGLDNIKISREVLTIDPTSLTVNLLTGETTSRTIYLTNNGATDLGWTGHIQSDKKSPAQPSGNPIGYEHGDKSASGNETVVFKPETLKDKIRLTTPPSNPNGIAPGSIIFPANGDLQGIINGAKSAAYYSQTGNPSPEGGIASQTFSDITTYTCAAADDFVIPYGETWNINHVFASGLFYNGGYTLPGVHVIFYYDGGGIPGSVAASFTDIPCLSDAIGNLHISLPSTVILTEGTYWLSVAANMPFSTYGQWGWMKEVAPSILTDYEWTNPDNGFGTGCTGWCFGSTILGGADQNLGFALSNTDWAPWLSFNPRNDYLSAGMAEPVTVSFDATGLGEGVYSGLITFSADNTVYPVTLPVTLNVFSVPENTVVPTTTITDGESSCFDATNTVTVGGSGNTFTVQSGGQADLLAGYSVKMLYGTKVFSGGYLLGKIVTDNEYCAATKSPEGPVAPQKEAEVVQDLKTNLFQVYPNPTTGTFTVRLSGTAPAARSSVKIFNMMGDLVTSDEMTTTEKVFSLGTKSDGIYLIYVTSGDRTESAKIVRTH